MVEIANGLTIIFQSSLDMGVVPEHGRVVNVPCLDKEKGINHGTLEQPR